MHMCIESQINYDCYTITKDGKIYSKYKNRYALGHSDRKGYIRITLKCNDGSQNRFYFHRVIWYYFNGEIPDDMQIDHIIPISDGGTNELSNLRLVTPKENANNPMTIRKNRSRVSKSKKMVDKIDLETGEVIATFPSLKQASEELGFSQPSISRCCKGGYTYKGKWISTPQAYGYTWRYII